MENRYESVLTVELLDELLNQTELAMSGSRTEAIALLKSVRSILQRHTARMEKLLELKELALSVRLDEKSKDPSARQ